MTESALFHTSEHPFAQYVRILGKGKKGARSLSFDEAYTAMGMILRGEARPEQIGALLMLLRVKEESPEEIAGFVAAARDQIAAPSIAVPSVAVDVDWSSYAGKRKHLPWYLCVTFLLASNGYRVFMHGTDGHTSGRLYTERVLQDLGLPVAGDWDDVRQQLDARRFSYLPLRYLSNPLHQMIELRNVLGLRSPIHTMSRMLNPLSAPYSFQSIFHPPYALTHLHASEILKQPNMAVFKGEGGEIERKPDATCLVRGIRNGEIYEQEWPRLLDGRQEAPEQLDAKYLQAIWRGERTDDYATAAVCGTLAICLQSLNRAATQQEASELAQQWWQQRDRSWI
jgi:anthranilate phosphoribosyltransferase